MNVVQIVPRYPPRTGGVETHVAEISERLVERGADVTVLTADAGDEVQRRESRNGVEVIRHRGVAPSGAFHIAPGILWTLLQIEADVVHAHNYHSLPLMFAAVGTRGRRFIATPHYHGGSASSFRDQLLLVYSPAGEWALGRAEEIIAVSEWERNRLYEDFGVEASVIPNGVNVERFQEATPKQRVDPYLLTVGRLEEYKGVQHIIRTLTELPDYDLLIAGSGPYREELERTVAAAGVRDQVTFLGYVDDNELPSLYAGAEVFLTMSSFEAFGMTVGEALAAGTPCVVRRRAALGDWVRREGCIGVSDMDPESIATAVNKAAGLKPNADSLPTWDEAVDALEPLYESPS